MILKQIELYVNNIIKKTKNDHLILSKYSRIVIECLIDLAKINSIFFVVFDWWLEI